MVKLARLFLSVLLMANLAAACATHQRVQTDTVQYEDQRSREPVAVERRTTTTTQTSTSEDSGVLSGTVNVVGEVLALPFRAVGGLLRAIF
jgi:type IV pilus biogenesis protein CpaD/CtpE